MPDRAQPSCFTVGSLFDVWFDLDRSCPVFISNPSKSLLLSMGRYHLTLFVFLLIHKNIVQNGPNWLKRNDERDLEKVWASESEREFLTRKRNTDLLYLKIYFFLSTWIFHFPLFILPGFLFSIFFSRFSFGPKWVKKKKKQRWLW